MKTPDEKWEADLPLNLKELSEVQGVSYKTAVRWASDSAFPRVGRLVRRRDFLKWWKDKATHPSKASHRPRTDDCKSRAPLPSCDLLASLPMKAARLRDAIASHS
jgi:predicted DNA-binding transcriptional regulator AlpA